MVLVSVVLAHPLKLLMKLLPLAHHRPRPPEGCDPLGGLSAKFASSCSLPASLRKLVLKMR